MSLSTALGIAQQSLRSTSQRTQVVSRNITDADNPDYVRRNAVVSSQAPGARVITIQRATDAALFRANIGAISAYEGQGTLRAGIDTLAQSVHGVEHANSAAKAIGSLQEALDLFAANPGSASIAENAVEAARRVVRSLNDGTSATQAFRADADMQISVAVDELNRLLAQFEDVNRLIVAGTQSGKDISDLLDRREALLKRISEYVSVSTISRANNDMVLTTASGVTLFETVPRQVTFQPQPGYAAGTSGNPIYVDGVPLAAGSGGDTTASGKLAGLMQLRETVAPALQAQLDEVARALISAFAETGPGGALAARTGLFTWNGGPTLPPSGAIWPGLAGLISVNIAADSTRGGNAFRLRDGGMNGLAYEVNATGAASFTELLIGYGNNIDASTDFDPAAGIGARASVAGFATASIGWLENYRQQAANAEQTKGALLAQTTAALAHETGVNIDQEMSLLLELEHSYEASARIIRAVDEMLAALLAVIR
jgi:flagellar hook-associated protein 1 FlgK